MAEIGYYTGVTDVYGAIIDQEDSAAAAPTYQDPFKIGSSIKVTLTPKFKEGSLYASNVAQRRINKIDAYDVSMELDQIAHSVRAKIFGRTVDANGVHVITGNDDPPYLALAFTVTKDNGGKELWWLYKGKLKELTVEANTETDSIDYTTPTVEGTFDRRIFDNALGTWADTDSATLAPSVVLNWFSQVYEKAAEANPGE